MLLFGVELFNNLQITLSGQGTNDGCGSRNGPVIGGPFSLIDTNGRLVTEKDLQGHWILLHFGYTSSPDVGPAELLKLAKAMKMLASADSEQTIMVQPVFVTLDPQRDTPSQLRAYLKGRISLHMTNGLGRKRIKGV